MELAGTSLAGTSMAISPSSDSSDNLVGGSVASDSVASDSVASDSVVNNALTGGSAHMRYGDRVVRRAQRAVLSSPFYLKLLAEMRSASVSVPTIAEDSGMLKGYTRRPLSEVSAERELVWLAEVGLLRREVDGQGLTDSFRLTPLGRQIVEEWRSQGCPDSRVGFMDYVKNGLTRRLRIPDWLG